MSPSPICARWLSKDASKPHGKPQAAIDAIRKTIWMCSKSSLACKDLRPEQTRYDAPTAILESAQDVALDCR